MRLTVFIADGDRALRLTWRVMYYWPADVPEGGGKHILRIPARATQLLASGKTRRHVRRRPVASGCRSPGLIFHSAIMSVRNLTLAAEMYPPPDFRTRDNSRMIAG